MWHHGKIPHLDLGQMRRGRRSPAERGHPPGDVDWVRPWHETLRVWNRRVRTFMRLLVGVARTMAA